MTMTPTPSSIVNRIPKIFARHGADEVMLLLDRNIAEHFRFDEVLHQVPAREKTSAARRFAASEGTRWSIV